MAQTLRQLDRGVESRSVPVEGSLGRFGLQSSNGQLAKTRRSSYVVSERTDAGVESKKLTLPWELDGRRWSSNHSKRRPNRLTSKRLLESSKLRGVFRAVGRHIAKE